MVMVWLEGGRRKVRGACDEPTLGLGGMYPLNRPPWTPPPPQATLSDPPPPPKSPPDPHPRGPPANGQLGGGGGGSWHPEPRSRPVCIKA